jgi:ankyrin repeat protein
MPPAVSAAEEARYAELQQLALEFARRGETAALAPMLRHGLPPNLADAKGNTLLMLAAYHGQAETARLLLTAGADVDRRNDRGQTPLGGVAFKGDTALVELLLAAGADLEADNGGGMTPLMFAAMFGRTAVVTQLQRAGASSRRRSRLGLSAGLLVRWAPGIEKLRAKLTRSSEPSAHPFRVL